ncbi:hypothetical protein KPL71_001580 [Citrus sinensis]|uniref:Uncharacterized protein n=1 Tax=Citrus sinensis TaxID=2711 RepID=A0ACB8NYM8_CITSI|nr:hypothetical protein KPL71_001580 [Citrus sinensis]
MLRMYHPQLKPIAVGPWGGQNGTRWDDGVHTTVRQLVIAHGAGIDSIQIEYDNKGGSCWSEKHGGKKLLKFGIDDFVCWHISVQPLYNSITFFSSVLVAPRLGATGACRTKFWCDRQHVAKFTPTRNSLKLSSKFRK